MGVGFAGSSIQKPAPDLSVERRIPCPAFPPAAFFLEGKRGSLSAGKQMMDEEKQLDNTQSPKDKATEGSESVASFSAAELEAVPGDSQPQATGGAADLEAYAAAYASEPAAASSGAAEEFAPAAEPAVVEALLQEIEGLKVQLEDFRSQYARLAADFDNFRKRTAKEKDDIELQVKCSTIKELLPVVDNFERARAQIKPLTDGEMNIHKSYQSVYKQMVDCLKRIGVAPMRSKGTEFDPNLHEAVMREATDEHPEGTVLEELVPGYTLGERVLRHALVKVAAAPEPPAAPVETSPEEVAPS
jgi:molecular chaperone GrpE